MKRIVVLPDIQVPFHDPKAVAAVTEFVGSYEPDELWCVGDEGDSPEPSRWNKGTAAEYADTFWSGVMATRAVMRQFREAVAGKPFHVMRSNHMDRIETYVRRYAPALTSLPQLRIESLYGYDEMGVTYHRRLWEGAPGWVMAHGDEGSLRHTAGGTAVALARKLGRSVVCGHTHRLGLVPESVGFNGKLTTVVGFEVGHLMDVKQAHYLKTGGGNWQQGLGLLYVEGRRVTPVAVPVQSASFVVEGRRYG